MELTNNKLNKTNINETSVNEINIIEAKILRLKEFINTINLYINHYTEVAFKDKKVFDEIKLEVDGFRVKDFTEKDKSIFIAQHFYRFVNFRIIEREEAKSFLEEINRCANLEGTSFEGTSLEGTSFEGIIPEDTISKISGQSIENFLIHYYRNKVICKFCGFKYNKCKNGYGCYDRTNESIVLFDKFSQRVNERITKEIIHGYKEIFVNIMENLNYNPYGIIENAREEAVKETSRILARNIYYYISDENIVYNSVRVEYGKNNDSGRINLVMEGFNID